MAKSNHQEMTAAPSRVQESAQKLQRHIRASGLMPGDRYITAADASVMLGENVTTVQRAMALLARSNILERRPRAGTFVGPAIETQDELSCVHFFIPEQVASDPGVQQGLWDQIAGMRQVLPHLSVQFNFVHHRDVAHAKQIIAKVGDGLTGVVLVLSSRELRSHFNSSGIPTVVWGGVEADLPNLCWVNWDQVHTGQLLTQYLVDRGHERMAMIMRDVWSVGEHQLHDGVSETLGQRGMPANAMIVRSAPSDRQAIGQLVQSLLDDAKAPTGFICRTFFQADCLREVIEKSGRKNVDVVVCNAPAASENLRYTCCVSDMPILEMGGIVGQMLRDSSLGKTLKSRGRNIPVRLHEVG